MKKRYNDMTLPMAEMSVLKELEEILQASGSLGRKETIPVQLQSPSDRSPHDIGVLIENHAVVALSVRYSTLAALPSSIDQFTSLREVDLTGNLLTALHTLDVGRNELISLPDSLGKLTNLTFFLYLHDNRLTSLPASLFENLSTLRYHNLTDNSLNTGRESIGTPATLKSRLLSPA